jgi:hypothetical protein
MIKYEKLGDGLIYYKDLIEEPYKIIDDLESLMNKVEIDIKNNAPGISNSSAKPWHNWDHVFPDGNVLHFCKQFFLPRSEDIKKTDLYYDELGSIADRLFNPLDQGFNYYSKELYPYASRNIKGKEDRMSILKYEKMGHLSEHTDHGSSSRTLSVVLYLNDNYEGGEIIFKNVGEGGVKIKPEAGSAIFFPSNYVFAHEVLEIKNGIRYALPNWYHNMNPKMETDGTE